MPDMEIIHVDSDQEVEYMSIGTRVREIEVKDLKTGRRREGVIFADSNVNGSRIFNVKWDNGSKDFVDSATIEPIDITIPRKKVERRSLFSILSKSSPSTTNPTLSNDSFQEYRDSVSDNIYEDKEEEFLIGIPPDDKDKVSEDSNDSFNGVAYDMETIPSPYLDMSDRRTISKHYNGETINMDIIEESDDGNNYFGDGSGRMPGLLCNGCSPM